MSIPTNQFTLFYGTDQTLQLVANVATPIAGWTIQYTIRQYFRGPALLTISGSAITITDAANWIFTVKITAAQLSYTNEVAPVALPIGSVPGLFYGDAERIDAGHVTPLTPAKITILAMDSMPLLTP